MHADMMRVIFCELPNKLWNVEITVSCIYQKTFTVPRILCKKHYKTNCNKHKLTQKEKARTRLKP